MNFILYLTKGRNYKEFSFFLKKKSILLLKKKNRKLIIKSNIKNIFFLKLKTKDFKLYIKKNLIDFLFIGLDSILNKKISLFFNYKFLKINLFFLSIISNESYKFSKKRLKTTIKSKYYIEYLKIKNIKIKNKNIMLSGGLENSCLFNFSNITIDIVSSGETIKDNKIFELKKIYNFKNSMIYNFNLLYNKIIIFMIDNYVEI